MKKELEEKLREDFPILYQDLYGDPSKTCMAWGFSHGDGWYDLVRDLSENLTKEINKLPEEERIKFKALQVKEKFAELRYYFMGPTTEEMDRLIEEAECKSIEICEACGKPGRVVGKRWLYTACEEHTKEEDRRLE